MPVPELPDVTVYIEALTAHVVGRRLNQVRLLSPFVLRTVDPPVDGLSGATVHEVTRVGKRIALAFGPLADADTLILVIHLMIAGRLRWREPGQKAGIGPKIILAALEFEHGTLLVHRGRLEEARVAPGGARRGRRSRRSIPAASSRSTRRSTSSARR